MEEQKQKIDRKCPYCSRWFRGEGFEKACTSHCHYRYMYTEILHPTKQKKTYKKKEAPPKKNKEMERIQKINKTWLDKKDTPKPRYSRLKSFEYAQTYGNISYGWDKKFNAARR